VSRARRSRKRRAASRRRNDNRRARRGWIHWPTERLLDLRIRDLHLTVERTELSGRIRELYRELEQRGFVFRPHFWLSNEWFSPDGVPGIAVPFFLAHPRLKRLEREMMLEIEGGTREHCLKLLRHETGHALLNAYRLHHRRDWQRHFGRSSQKYPDTYLPRPHSKSFVLHLENWYAQSHPHEDWAETFAVWLKPGSDWRRRYRDWPALRKLEYVDNLMQEILKRRPRVRNRRAVYPLRSFGITLREYYADKQKRYGKDGPEFFDRDLRRLFSDSPEHRGHEKASRYIRRRKIEVINLVARWTSEYHYRINEVLKHMIARCDALKMRVALDDDAMRREFPVCVTTLVMNKLHTGGFRVSL